MAVLESIRSDWLGYSMSTISVVLFFGVIAWVILFEKEKINNHIFIYSILVTFFLVVTQVAVYFFLGNRSLEKMFYLLPVGMLIPYGGVLIWRKLRQDKKRWVAIWLYAIIVQSAIGLRYTSATVQGGMNIYKISPDVMLYASYIKEDAGGDEAFLLAPEKVASQIQEYDVDIRVAYGPGYEYYYGNLEQLLLQMDAFGCNYLLVPMEYNDEEYVKSRNYRLVVIFKGHALYARE